MLGVEMQAVGWVLKDTSMHKPVWMGFDDLKQIPLNKDDDDDDDDEKHHKTFSRPRAAAAVVVGGVFLGRQRQFESGLRLGPDGLHLLVAGELVRRPAQYRPASAGVVLGAVVSAGRDVVAAAAAVGRRDERASVGALAAQVHLRTQPRSI